MDDLIIISDQRPTRADAVRNRDGILCTARRMFDAQGADVVTMSAIALEAGVGKGTLYRNFPDKLSLVQALLDEDQRDLQDRTLAHLRTEGAPVEHLCWFMENVLAFVWRNLDILKTDGPLLPLEHPAHYWWRQTIRGLIHQVNRSIDAEQVADILYIMLDPRVIQYQRDVRRFDTERIQTEITKTAQKLLAS